MNGFVSSRQTFPFVDNPTVLRMTETSSSYRLCSSSKSESRARSRMSVIHPTRSTARGRRVTGSQRQLLQVRELHGESALERAHRRHFGASLAGRAPGQCSHAGRIRRICCGATTEVGHERDGAAPKRVPHGSDSFTRKGQRNSGIGTRRARALGAAWKRSGRHRRSSGCRARRPRSRMARFLLDRKPPGTRGPARRYARERLPCDPLIELRDRSSGA